VIVIARGTHQRRLSIPAHGGAGGGGEPRPIRSAHARVLSAHTRPEGIRRGPGGQPKKNNYKTIMKHRSGRLERCLEGPGILGIPPAAYPAKQSATTAGVKRRA
jgi:hypothetical protein